MAHYSDVMRPPPVADGGAMSKPLPGTGVLSVRSCRSPWLAPEAPCPGCPLVSYQPGIAIGWLLLGTSVRLLLAVDTWPHATFVYAKGMRACRSPIRSVRRVPG